MSSPGCVCHSRVCPAQSEQSGSCTPSPARECARGHPDPPPWLPRGRVGRVDALSALELWCEPWLCLRIPLPDLAFGWEVGHARTSVPSKPALCRRRSFYVKGVRQMLNQRR